MTADLPTKISPIENYDPFGKFLNQTLRISPFGFGILVLIANVLVDLWLGWRFNVFLSPPGSSYPGLLQDFTAIVVDFVSIPIVAGLYLWTPFGATHLFKQLLQAGVFKSEAVVIDPVGRSRPLFGSRKVFHVIWAISLLYTLSQLAAYLGWVPWQSAVGYLNLNPSMSYARAPFWFLNFYTLAYAAFNIIVTVITLRRMFRTKEIQLLPLHPDKCGGLVSISQYSVKVAYGIASAGLVISAVTVFALQHGTLRSAYPIILGIVAYLILAPVYFFWPLGTAHNAMQEAKEAELLRIAERFGSVYQRLAHETEEEDQDNSFEEDVKKLENLEKLYQIAQEFPIWPFDLSNLRRFFTVITTPLIPAFISIIIDVVASYFFR